MELPLASIGARNWLIHGWGNDGMDAALGSGEMLSQENAMAKKYACR